MTYDLYIKELDLEVELDCHVTSESTGIGSYEYWGQRGYDAGFTYPVIEQFEWDKSLYTDEQNELIDKYIIENWNEIEGGALKNFDPY